MTMKRLSFLIAALLVAGMAYSQKKPKITLAERYWKEGTLGEAKAIVDNGIVHEKTKEKDRTWYIRGLVYASIDTTSNMEYSSLADDALGTAMEAFAKASELSGSKENYILDPMGLPLTQTQQINDYWGYYFNEGAVAFGDNNYEGAYNAFLKAQRIMPSDTNSYINAGLAAQNQKLFDKAEEQYKGALAQGAESGDTYGLIIYAMMQQEKYDEALVMVKEAREKYPANSDLGKTEVDLYIKLDKIEDAKNGLIEAIEAEPENTNLLFNLGVLYENLEDTDNAIKAYQRAVEVDPAHYNSHYNIGVLLINEATVVIKEKNSLGITKADLKKAEELDVVIQEKLKGAVPRWEKLYELNATDRTTLETLQYIYTQLRMNDKAEKMYNELQALGDED